MYDFSSFAFASLYSDGKRKSDSLSAHFTTPDDGRYM